MKTSELIEKLKEGYKIKITSKQPKTDNTTYIISTDVKGNFIRVYEGNRHESTLLIDYLSSISIGYGTYRYYPLIAQGVIKWKELMKSHNIEIIEKQKEP